MTRPGLSAGGAGRVAVARRQARRTLAVSVAYALAASVAAIVPHRTGWWLPLHLFLVGGVLSAVSGATQLFAVTWAAGRAPPDWAVTAQRVLVGGGALVLVLGRELRAPTSVAVGGGAAVIAGLTLLGLLLAGIVRSAVLRRFDPAQRFYLAGLASGILGCGLGLVLLAGAGADTARVKAAHVTLNLLGLVGLVIVGTLPFFSATEARTRMSPRATRRAQAMLLGWLLASLTAAVAGVLGGARLLASAGLGGYAAGLVALATLLPGIGAKQLRWAGPRVVQLGAGMLWWAAGAAAAALRAFTGLPPFSMPALAMIVVGGYAQILVAALAYLGPVLRGGGHRRLSAGFSGTRSWMALGAANVAAASLAAGWALVGAGALAVLAGDTGWRALRLAWPRRPGNVRPPSSP
jgi:nitrite reductase (NO-forming)